MVVVVVVVEIGEMIVDGTEEVVVDIMTDVEEIGRFVYSYHMYMYNEQLYLLST